MYTVPYGPEFSYRKLGKINPSFPALEAIDEAGAKLSELLADHQEAGLGTSFASLPGGKWLRIATNGVATRIMLVDSPSL